MMIGTALAILALSQSPSTPARAASPAPASSMSPRRAAELKKLSEARKARRAQAGQNRAKVLGLRRPPAPQQGDAPAQPSLLQQNQALIQQNQALQSFADVAQRQAAVAAAQYRLNSQVAGVPQVFVPGVGMVPYEYGIATPAPALGAARPGR